MKVWDFYKVLGLLVIVMGIFYIALADDYFDGRATLGISDNFSQRENDWNFAGWLVGASLSLIFSGLFVFVFSYFSPEDEEDNSFQQAS